MYENLRPKENLDVMIFLFPYYWNIYVSTTGLGQYPTRRTFIVWTGDFRGSQPGCWVLVSQSPTFRNFTHFSALSQHYLPIEYHLRICPFSDAVTHVKWTWFNEFHRYFHTIKNP